MVTVFIAISQAPEVQALELDAKSAICNRFESYWWSVHQALGKATAQRAAGENWSVLT